MDRARFTALWERCLIDGHASDADRIFDLLLAHYCEPHRRYHTPAHIDHCLRQIDLAVDEMHEKDAVEMAIWFHDAIYNVPADGNERRSADLFMELASGGMPVDFKQRVHDMIMVTQHPQEPTKNDDKFVVDVDLSSFGLPWDRMKKDSQNVRGEFPDVDDKNFYAGHIRFVRALLDRSTFFATDFFRERYEAQARSNITRLLEELRVAGFG